MENAFFAVTLNSLLIVLAVAVFTACTEAGPEAGISSAQAAAPVTPLYPPIQADAGDGHVYEYY